MTGRFIAVVGPSGVGKDSVMTAMAAADTRLALARRVITRPSNAGGESFVGITTQEFEARRDAHGFALWWAAHGLLYGIPCAVESKLAAGQDVLANLSRSMLEQASDKFERFEVIALTARPDVLKQRLIARARENTSDIENRLRRASYLLPVHIPARTLDNSGHLEDTVTRALDVLYPPNSKRSTS